MAACPGRSWQARCPGASARRAWTYLICARFQRLWRILQRTSRWKAAASIRASWSLAATIRLNTMASKWCSAGRVSYSQQYIVDAYIERIRRDIRLARPLKLAVDCGNGIAGAVAPRLFRALGCE